MSKKKSLFAKLLPLLILAVAVSAYAYMKATKPERPKPQAQEKVWLVDYQSVAPAVFAPVLTLYGEVESNSLLRASAPGAGQIETVDVRAGDRVKQGQLLIRMDSRDFAAALLQAEADVADIDAQLAEHELKNAANLRSLEEEKKLLQLARQELQRIESLKNRNLSSDSALNDAREMLGNQELSLIQKQLEVDRYETTAKQLRARLARARAREAEARLALERSTVVAGFDGIVSEVPVSPGDRVNNSALLISLYPMESLEVRARIPATYQAEMHRQLDSGSGLSARARLNDQTIDLQLVRLAGNADPSGIDGFFKVKGEPSGLRVGNLVEIDLQRPQQDQVIAIPFRAIYGNDRIFLYHDGRMKALEVESLGQYRDPQGKTWLLVRNRSIADGDKVVTTHLPNAVDGLKVKLRGVDSEEAGDAA